MLGEQLIALSVAMLAMGGFWWLVPRCPECGFLLSVKNTHDPSLRHCRRCMAIYHSRERR
jgi:hypothetical protein